MFQAIYKYDLHVVSALLKDTDEPIEWAQDGTEMQVWFSWDTVTKPS